MLYPKEERRLAQIALSMKRGEVRFKSNEAAYQLMRRMSTEELEEMAIEPREKKIDFIPDSVQELQQDVTRNSSDIEIIKEKIEAINRKKGQNYFTDIGLTHTDRVKLDGIEAGADVTGNHNPKVHAPSHGIGGGDNLNIIRSASKVIAAYNAPNEWLNQADVVCDGTADEVQINAKITKGETVLLSPGLFKTADEVLVNQGGAILKGSGWHYHTSTGVLSGTIIQPQAAMTNSINISGEECHVHDLFIDGNNLATQFKNENYYNTISHVGSVNHTTYSLYSIGAAGGNTGLLYITNHCMFLYKPVRLKGNAITIDGGCYFNGDGKEVCLILDLFQELDLIDLCMETFLGSAITYGEVGSRHGFSLRSTYFEGTPVVTNVLDFINTNCSIDGVDISGNYMYADTNATNFMNIYNGSGIKYHGNFVGAKPLVVGSGVSSIDAVCADYGTISYNSLTGLTYLKKIESGTRFYGISEFRYATAPTVGTWLVGDKVLNTTPVAGGAPGWICTTAGTPGTWSELPPLSLP